MAYASMGSAVRYVQNINSYFNKTFGDRPRSFALEDGGDLYCIGSEVFLYAFLQIDVFILYKSVIV